QRGRFLLNRLRSDVIPDQLRDLGCRTDPLLLGTHGLTDDRPAVESSSSRLCSTIKVSRSGARQRPAVGTSRKGGDTEKSSYSPVAGRGPIGETAVAFGRFLRPEHPTPKRTDPPTACRLLPRNTRKRLADPSG